MTRFTVVWKREADDELTEIWLRAADRNPVSEATAAIDRELRDDPGSKGEPVAEGLRKLIIPPLVVLFWVSDEDRRVQVDNVHTLPH